MARAPIPLALVTAFWLGACGAPESPPPREPEARTASPSAEASPAAPTPAPPEASAPLSATPRAGACAEVHMGLDLRALPRGTSSGGIDMFVGGQASDFADKAPSGAAPEIRTMPGAGVFDALFRGAVEADEVARCEQTVAAYLATAPRLPILMEPAGQVITPCRPCSSP